MSALVIIIYQRITIFQNFSLYNSSKFIFIRLEQPPNIAYINPFSLFSNDFSTDDTLDNIYIVYQWDISGIVGILKNFPF